MPQQAHEQLRHNTISPGFEMKQSLNFQNTIRTLNFRISTNTAHILKLDIKDLFKGFLHLIHATFLALALIKSVTLFLVNLICYVEYFHSALPFGLNNCSIHKSNWNWDEHVWLFDRVRSIWNEMYHLIHENRKVVKEWRSNWISPVDLPRCYLTDDDEYICIH